MMPMNGSHSSGQRRGVARRVSALLTPKRMAVWGTALLILSWSLYVYVMAVPGYIDRAGRFKGTDYIYFYVMGSLLGEGKTDALYDGEAHLAQGRQRITPDLRLYASHSNYGPQIALLLEPLARLPFGSSLAAFLSLTALAYGFSVWLVWRECAALQGHGRLVALLAAASPLFLTLVRYAQLSALSLLIWSVALVLLRRRRDFAAGLAIGCLAFKPQLGIIVGIVMLAAGDWRVVAGAMISAGAQLAVGLWAGGSDAMLAYFRVLWTLARNPSLVQLFPSEIHSVRGFFQLLVPSGPIVAIGSLVALIVAIVMAVRSWMAPGPLTVRWGLVLLLAVLSSPHLVSYDLVLLTVPLLLFADWAVQHVDDWQQPRVVLTMVLVYLAPFSSNFARLIHVQLSVVAMVLLAWWIYRWLTARPHSGAAARLPS
jgi:Glycosyltransferase family 87